MTNIVKNLKLLWKRSKFLIILLLALVTIYSLNSTKTDIRYMRFNGFEQMELVNEIYEKDYSLEELKNVPINISYESNEALDEAFPKDYLDESLKKVQALIEKYDIKVDEDNRYLEHENKEELSDFIYLLQEIYFYTDYYDLTERTGNLTFDKASEFAFRLRIVLVVAFVLCIYLMSAEKMTDYYDFTRLFPWSKTKTFLTKVLFSLFFVFVFFALDYVIKYFMWSNSIYKNIVTLFSSNYFLNSIVNISSFVLILMGLGAVAGNFLGQCGMFIIAFFGVNLPIMLLSPVFEFLKIDSLFQTLNNFLLSIPRFFTGILDYSRVFDYGLLETAEAYALTLGGLALGVLCILFGIYFSKKADNSMVKKPIMNKYLSLFCLICATLGGALILFLFFGIFDMNTLISIPIYIASLFASYKLFSFVFNTDIGV